MTQRDLSSADSAEPAEGTLAGLLYEQARRRPDALAILAPGRPALAFDGLGQQVSAIAAALRSLGATPDTRVAVVLPNGPEMATAFLGTAACAICAPLNPAYREAEFRFYLEDLRARIVVVRRGERGPAASAAKALGLAIVEIDEDATLPAGRFETATALAGRPAPVPWPRPTAAALFLHTSGTTGRPKIVPLSQANLVASARSIAGHLALQPGDRCLNVMPLFHIHGLVGALLASVAGGGSIVCTPGFDRDGFFDWVAQFDPTWYTATPTIHQSVVDQGALYRRKAPMHRFRFVRSSSSALAPSLFDRLQDLTGAPVVEAYGMTEAAHQMTSNPLPPATRKPGSVGIPAGADVALRGEAGLTLGPGASGEIVIRGPGVTAGYESNPEANVESFVDGWFRTGDLGRFDDDGYLFISGRLKEIVNRGGEKISPQEIDAALLAHPDVVQAVAYGVPHPTLGEDLAAAVVLRDGAAADEETLRAYLFERLADFKVPSSVIVVDAIPKGATGKVQRKGLHAKLGTRSAPSFAAPRTGLERSLEALFREVLGCGPLGVDDNFFAAGGDSLKGTQVVARINARHRVELAVPVLFRHPTLAALAREVEAAQEEAAASPGDSTIARRAAATSSRLSFAQEGLWFLDKMDEPGGAYNNAFALRLSGALDVAALERSVRALLERHEILRTAFETRDGSAVQVVRPIVEVAAEVRLEPLPLGDGQAVPSERLLEWLHAEAAKPFDLARAPLLRARLLRSGAAEYVLLLVVHHIAFDGWSTGVLMRELGAAYAHDAENAALAPLPIQFADYASWQRDRSTSPALQRQLEYWRRQLDGLETLDLPTDRSRPAHLGYRGSSERYTLPGSLLGSLEVLAQRERCTLFMVLLGAFQVLLMRHTRQLDLAVGVPVAGRPRADLEGLIGCFVNTLVMRADLSGDPAFTELLGRVRQTALDAYAYQELPFDRLVAALSPQRDLGRHPLYQVSFALNNQPAHGLVLQGIDVEVLELPVTTSKFDLSLALAEVDGGLRGTIEYSTDLFDAASIVRFAAQYRRLLESIVAEPTQHIARLALMDEAEQCRLLAHSNGAEVTYPAPQGVHRLVEAQVRRSPHAVAAVFEGRETGYRELNARANRLAHRLRGLGVGPDVPVGLCIERSLSALVAVLGILKSGGAYVPLDPEHPAERLAFMLKDCAAPIVITQRSLRERVAGTVAAGTRLVVVDDDAEAAAIAAQPELDLDSPTQPEHLAYVIYTSGSTGEPKGVEIEHRGIGNQLHWLAGAARFEASDRVLFKTSICFDASVIEMLTPLICGACVVIAPPGAERDIHSLPAFIAGQAVTVLQLVPSALRALLDAPALPACSGLRYLICGGEALDRDLARAVKRLLPDVALGNFYGPTETSVDASWHEVGAIAAGAGTVPIGRPVSNTRCHVLDDRLQPVPVGVIGELCIGGAGLARGYLNRPALTAERFVADPFRPGERLYRSGDLARYLADGTLECVGRIDDQVKLRGFRIELGEIEVALRACPGVRQSAVLLREDRPGSKQLIGYVAGGAGEPAALRESLARRLPAHMIPAAIVRLDEWPLLPNGKLDRSKLPPPDADPTRARREAAGSALEKSLLQIWSAVLGVKTIGVDDDFFELGGDSLLAIRLLATIEKTLGAALHVATLFQSPTIRRLAAAIGRQGARPFSCAVALQPHGSRPPLFTVSGSGGGVDPFRPLARELGTDQPLYVLDIGTFAREKDDFTLQELARRICVHMREVQPVGPYHLAGYSLGGKIVFEMAVQLADAGQEVALVALLDSAAPGYPRRAVFPLRVLRHLRHGVALGPAAGLRYLAERVWRLKKYLGGADPEPAPVSPKSSTDATPQAANAVDRARKRYAPTRYPGRLLLVRAEVRARYPGLIDEDPALGWGALVGGGVQFASLHCRHLEMLDPENARALASVLEPHLAGGNVPEARAPELADA